MSLATRRLFALEMPLGSMGLSDGSVGSAARSAGVQVAPEVLALALGLVLLLLLDRRAAAAGGQHHQRHDHDGGEKAATYGCPPSRPTMDESHRSAPPPPGGAPQASPVTWTTGYDSVNGTLRQALQYPRRTGASRQSVQRSETDGSWLSCTPQCGHEKRGEGGSPCGSPSPRRRAAPVTCRAPSGRRGRWASPRRSRRRSRAGCAACPSG